MADMLAIMLVYIALWIVATTLVYIKKKPSPEDRVVITPIVATWRTAFTFEKFAKFRNNKYIGFIFDLGIINMFLIMFAAYYVLVSNLLRALHTGERVGVVAPIIPGVTIGINTFMYILPGLIVAALLHEAFHAMAARYEGINVRSSGLMLLLGIIPAAFVEPEEEDLLRAPIRAKLRVYAAGVLANTLLFLAFSGALFAIAKSGYYIAVSTVPGSVAAKAGLPETIIVEKIVVNGTEFNDIGSFISYISKIRSEHGGSLRGVVLNVAFVATDGTIYKIVKPVDVDVIGIYLYPIPKSLAALGPHLASSLFLILYYGQAVNIGLAGINALPIFITDGAQFLQALVEKRLSAKAAKKVVGVVSVLTLALLLPNISL